MAGNKTTKDDTQQSLQVAQLEKIQLENEKLKRELADSNKAKPRYTLIQIIPMISPLIAVFGFLWGIFVYQDQQAKILESNERLLMKPWLDSQREIYSQALEDASVIANTDDPEKLHQAMQDFWQLYQGKMILVETTKVSTAMVKFGYCIDGTEQCNTAEMNKRCRALGTEMADSMAATAKMTYEEFAANQFKYSSGKKLTP